jgi:hypothetical protein
MLLPFFVAFSVFELIPVSSFLAFAVKPNQGFPFTSRLDLYLILN